MVDTSSIILGVIIGFAIGIVGLTTLIEATDTTYIHKDKIQSTKTVKVAEDTFKSFSCVRTYKTGMIEVK